MLGCFVFLFENLMEFLCLFNRFWEAESYIMGETIPIWQKMKGTLLVGNASYAFNNYYVKNEMLPGTCDFHMNIALTTLIHVSFKYLLSILPLKICLSR